MTFYYDQDFAGIDFREQPEKYRIGKGEQGVFMVEPYKSELLPHWRFKNPEVAAESSAKIYEMFLHYLAEDDFVGADMARKYLQMGYTRARRYANHKSGRKYAEQHKAGAPRSVVPPDYRSKRNRDHYIKSKTREALPREEDPAKAEAARIFYEKYLLAKSNEKYQRMKEAWKKQVGK